MKALLIFSAAFFLVHFSIAQDSLRFKSVPYKVAIYANADKLLVKGYLSSVSDTAVYVSPKEMNFSGYLSLRESLSSVPYKEITQIDIRRKGRTGTAILLGALGGTILGATVGFASGDDVKKNSVDWCLFCMTAGQKAGAGAVLFGLTGGLVGGLVAELSHKTFGINKRKDKFEEFKSKLFY